MDMPRGGSEPPAFLIERNPRLRFVIPTIVATAFLMEQLDQTVIVTAIPSMAESLHTTPLSLNLAITAYVLSLAMFIPLSGWMADRFGPRRIFALSLLVFTIGSILCGLATGFGTIIATRILQGLGGAMMTPVGRLILISSFPRRQLATAMAYMTYPAVIGPLLGPVVGGLLTTYLSWRWIFFINVPFGIAGMFAALRFVEDNRGDRGARFDLPGFLLVGFGFTFLQLGMESIGRGPLPPIGIGATLVAAVVLLLAFARYARGISAPTVDLTLFRDRAFRIGTLAGGLSRIGFNGVPFLLPLLLQLGFGLTPVVSGVITCVTALASLPARGGVTLLLRRWGFRRVLIGSGVAGALAIASFATLQPETPQWIIVAIVFVFGMTRSIQFMSSNMLSYADVAGPRLSRATSLGAVLQQLSLSFGISAAAVLLALVAGGGGHLTTANFHVVFLLSALISLLGIPGYLALRADDGEAVIMRRL
ncbi:MAG TPA: MFS transporter [Bauldia sp.]|nr:MFS transporter [Bauldia sp.]